ncbi:FAD-dependent pyridine nucleotide-disulfide oxidoreductase [Hyaloraphidium curvatum]|nr:FAD-dependent pyridine nucleotide-disulfide oxidoreductase [Hyaloraphidium curvatum]
MSDAAKPRVLILGAGFGGLELATRLIEELGKAVDITIVDSNPLGFMVGLFKIDMVFGQRRDYVPYDRIRAPGVKFLAEKVVKIDPAAKSVTTDQGTHEADYLVVALGADYAFEATPGFKEALDEGTANEFYSVPGAKACAPVVDGITEGKIVFGILQPPYKCPPAPFEVVLQLHDLLVEKGIRDKCQIEVISPNPIVLPLTKSGSAVLNGRLAELGITFHGSHPVALIDGKTKTISIKGKDEKMSYDYFFGIPAHTAPAVVKASGMSNGPSGFIKVDPKTLATEHADVWAIGDVMGIAVGQMQAPKAGSFAENGAAAVAEQIIARVTGQERPFKYQHKGVCYIEFGKGKVHQFDANIFGGDEPVVAVTGPTAEYLKEKETWASAKLERWFKME